MTKPTRHFFPGDYDLWLFSQNWLPRFCCDSPKRCKDQRKSGTDKLGTHGLWPAYFTPLKTGETFPSFCYSTVNPSDRLRGFDLHQWTKHGSCTVLQPLTYFNEISRVEQMMSNNVIHKLLANTASGTIATGVLQDKLGGGKNVAIKVNKYCQLNEITTCFKRREDGAVGEQTECPEHILSGSRNNAISMYKCNHLAVDSAARDDKCLYISQELLKEMKDNK